ncbi:MAG: hypothetical protein ACJ72D_14265 [Marmoricola sp.]
MPIEIQEVVVEAAPASASTSSAETAVESTSNPVVNLSVWHREVALRRDRLRAD